MQGATALFEAHHNCLILERASTIRLAAGGRFLPKPYSRLQLTSVLRELIDGV